ncbi:MAG: lysophospholipid acyltransferase family protein [Bacteroidales bacterium]|nr:lysophospholipid acyltransferase family protein [Bacteroidales bacterium]
MGAIGYYLFYGITWIITLLPLKILYLISDLLFLILYYFPSYRRKVVATNLRNSFPEKNAGDLAVIEKKFYRHLADLMIETLKLTHLSLSHLTASVKFTNPELINRLFSEGRDIVVVAGHYNNWEWTICFPSYTKYQAFLIYKPLQNKRFDRFMNGLRSKTGAHLTPMSKIVREIIISRQNNVRSIFAFIADQTPPKRDIQFWMNFLNQETPVYLGAEKIAAKYDMAVVFINIQKIKRGYYSLTCELLFEHTADLPENLITETHVRRLEEIIREKPEYWLWSHRRWKHKREETND